jgi:hypothetical protein
VFKAINSGEVDDDFFIMAKCYLDNHLKSENFSTVPTVNGFHKVNKTEFAIVLHNPDPLFADRKNSWWCSMLDG